MFAPMSSPRFQLSSFVTAGAEIGEIQRLGSLWSLFFRDPDGMELKVCCIAE
jgi:hypothetical protein